MLTLLVMQCQLFVFDNHVSAQTDTIRYVHPNGKYNNDGLSWATATNKLQDAINDLRDYLRRNNLTSGSVYVAAGTYIPTESTESAGGTMLNTSFKIYSGIHVYGGFNPSAPESKPGDRMMINNKKCSENWADPSGIGTVSGQEIASQWDLKYKTILTGNHSTSNVTFAFDSIRGRYNTTFPANSYHVVWFATNGQYTGIGVNDSTAGHFKPLAHMASVDGCVITSGNASSRSTTTREHTAYGGGVYMVGNSQLRNCTVERCNATLRGGGIYMDGGGIAEFCYVHTCQSTGVGVVQGYGGGVCIDHEGSLGHSHVTNCAARCGGGLLISHVPEDFPHVDTISYYSPFATACVINNNTASAEGGGIYLAEGGTINHCTVTANNCIGPDVTYYGRRHGRSGGIYVRNCGMIFNSVFWGNRCDANNDIQFATARQRIDANHQIFAYHTAFMNHDISDWTGVTKEMVFSLDKHNMPVQGSSANFPCFFDPTIDPLNWDTLNPSEGLYGAGVFMRLPNNNCLDSIPGPRIWHLISYSALDQKGVQVTNAVQDVSHWIVHAHTDYGVVTNPYEPNSTLGALVRKPDPMAYALIAPQGQEGRAGGASIPTLFIDPNRKGVFNQTTGEFVPQDMEGNSWTTPIKDLGEAISYFRQYLVDSVPGDHHYMIPALVNGKPTGEPTRYDYVQILVKQGTLTTAGPGNYLNRNIRTAAVRVESHMRLYGGYPTTLKNTDTSERNPRDYVTNITANITRISGAKGYENNSAHVIALVNAEKSIIDGFKLSDANTHNVELTGSVQAGGGMLVTNSSTPQAKRINMVGNQLRNCVVTNCTAPKGAAIYVNGEHIGPNDTICYAELLLMNCVIRNNKADYKTAGTIVTESHGVITANGRAYVHIEHCDIVNNVGYPFKADSKTTDIDPITGEEKPIYCNHEEHHHESIYHGYIRVDNSIIFCNGDSVVDDRGQLGSVSKVTSVNPEGQDYVFGMYNMFDADLVLHQADYHQPRGFFHTGYTVPITDHFMPANVGSHFIDDISNVPSDSTARNNKCILTRMDISDPNYPTFLNPSRNVGNSVNGDKPLYGGNVSYAPLTTNPCVNAAYSDYYTGVNNFDRTDNCTRDRGGAPDIGALENADLPAAGTVIYVTPEGRGKMDGSSWDNAIAGNLVYQIGGSYVVDAVNGDSVGNGVKYVTTKNNLYRGGYAVDYVYKTGTTTYVDKQTITQKRINLTYKLDGTYTQEEGESTPLAEKTNTQTITESSTLTRQKTGFIYGEKSGASRNFYRTNLKDSQISTAAQTNSGYTNVDIDNTLSITNNRDEDFVSGLQFAVEKAALYNKNKTKEERVQVWVGNGVYEDYKGFVMRNKVEVFGGFPVQKYNAPGMSERHALVSEGIPLSDKSSVQESEKAQYETILQIIDQRPYVRNAPLFEDANAANYTNKWAFNNDVILYRDSDYTESGTKTITTTTSVTIPVYYRRDSLPEGGYSAYYEVPGGNVEADLTGRIINPSFEQNGGRGNWSNTKAKYGWTDITGFSLGGPDTAHCAKIQNNENIDFYQDIENLEEGLYRVSVQAFNKGTARGNVKLVANGEERVLMNVLSGDGSDGTWAFFSSLFTAGKYSNNWVDVYVGASGHLRIGLKGTYSGSGTTVFDNFKLERLSGSEDITTTTTTEKATGYVNKKKSKGYTTFRKPVLYMPDVCLPTYWPGTLSNDNISNERRQNISGNVVTPKAGSGYVKYEDVHWDGFTIRNGFVYDYYANRDGGGGVRMFEGATLENCVVKDNTVNWGVRTRGGGGYCDGRTAIVIGCFFVNNLNSGIRNATPTSSNDKDSNGGGIYMLVGTCYNSLFANNACWGKDARGAGIYIEQSTFYNNTVAYNTCRNRDKSIVDKNSNGKEIGHGVHQYEGSNGGAVLNVFNTIFYGNTGRAIGAQDNSKINGFKNCYIQSTTATNGTIMNKMVDCIKFNGQAATDANNPFARLSSSPTENNFRLKDGSGCVNKGQIPNGMEDDFPSKDVDFAARVQDCQIDIGAYEYNAAYAIRPDTTSHPGQAIFYVRFDSPGGDASARSPENAACRQKLQQVLDAAGRYKHLLMTSSTYNKGASMNAGQTTINPFEANKPNKYWNVEVWLEGDSTNSTLNNNYHDRYTPTRSTKHGTDYYQDNTLDYSFIIPRGIHVRGGYKNGFYHEEGGKIVDDRDPLTYRSILSGKVTSSTGAEGNTFHVVTFTKDLFSAANENVIGNGNQLDSICTPAAAEKHRAVLDGLFIEDGYANAPDPADQIGAGAVVTDYAHIRNCVIQNNEAEANGGGLYLKPLALVSGTIIKKNNAEIGGGIYFEPLASHNTDSLARVYSTTICENTASQSAGGMWFDNMDARVNSTVIWQNSANDNANVSGSFSRSEGTTDYPFIFCAVESRRLEGQGNIELSPRETEGVRWDRQDPFDSLLYYPIEMSSTLSHSGMPYMEWNKAQTNYPTLDTTDIAGVSRTRWTSTGAPRGYAWGSDVLVTKNNDCIEIGARALNKTFEINVDPQYVMRRLYVMTSELIDSEAARALQDNTNSDDVSNMYRQMGSCIFNPFHRLGDAFDYIIAARKSNHKKYRNAVFEVYIEAGTYYPYHNAYGEQDEVRNNTFLIPEAIYVIGGIDSKQADHKYGQEGYHDQFTGDAIGQTTGTLHIPGTNYSINAALRDTIRLRDDRHRPMRDNNLNSVIEPWEFARQTILSGNAVAGEDFTHVYHVITMHADSTKVGPQPYKFQAPNPAYDRDNPQPGVPMFLMSDTLPMREPDLFHEECDLSILGRTTEFDGLQITGGYANHLDVGDTAKHHYQTKTYFRGGGIFVDGNWTESFDEPNANVPFVTTPAKYNIPIVVENCVFNNNMAGNGGALYSNGDIYMYGCHFTQNYSQGPMTELDQRFIPWTTGGCIATNATCDISNTLFDNNEARRGRYPITISGEERIPDADARQGFGGVLSVAQEAQMRVVNCHFMRNKAVAYPSIYNFLSNNRYFKNDNASDSKKGKGDKNPVVVADSIQIAVNTIFWGNEVFEIDSLTGKLDADDAAPIQDESLTAFNLKYRESRKGVFHYDGSVWNRYEKLYHEYDSLYNYWTSPERGAEASPFKPVVTDKLRELRQVGDSMEGLYFCSYRKGYGPTGMKPNKDGYLMISQAELDAYTDSRQTPVRLKRDANDDLVERSDSLFTYLHGNNNVLINRINNAADGPNFKQPSFVAGIDGYMQNADWLLARMNLTTDQGWGHLSQTVSRSVAYYITRYTGTQQFETLQAAINAANAALHTDTCTSWSVLPISGLPAAKFDTIASPFDAIQDPRQGIYNWYAFRYGYYMSEVNAPLPLGEQYYMAYTRSSNDAEMSGNMQRISKNPKMKEKDVYIDIGIYEYQYVQLDIKGQEIDTMWVATTSKGQNQDGLTWETPTTNLQYAIETLMGSHNNHDKYVCFLGDAENTISPINVIDNRRAFIVSSNVDSPLLPDSALADFDYGVRSLTFLGGYSFDVKDALRDPVAHPTVLEMPNAGTSNQLNQLVIVEDMTRQMTQANWQGEYVARDSVVIPIVFDGITFINPYSTKDPASESYTSLGGSMTGQGGAAIYYRWQRMYEDVGGVLAPNFNMALFPDSTLVDNRKVPLPKLTISNCTFLNNGARTTSVAERSPAVFIGYGGGGSLIVNSLFHSNAGAPIYSRHSDPLDAGVETNFNMIHNPAIIINSTSALNDGHLRLGCAHSEIHNSLIWKDDLASDTTTQLQIGIAEETEHWVWDKNTNNTQIGTTSVTNNAVWGCFVDGDDTYHNDNLSSDNKDIFYGPNFINPIDSTVADSVHLRRDFRLNPGLRTMNMADTTVYRNHVFFREYPDDTYTPDDNYWRRSNGFKSRLITALAQDSDLAAKPRLLGLGMERGAYECQAVLQRILYVQPTLPSSMAGDGSSWQNPFGQGQLQNALDAAAVYTYLNSNASAETQKAYVFVKGSYDATDQTDIVARDGVSVYGSLPNNFNDTAWLNIDSLGYTNGECQRYINYVRAVSTGVASPDATPTRINSIRANEGTFNLGFIMDGFVITNPNTVRTTSPIVLNNDKTVIRNCIIKDNKVDGAPVADIQNGLLYNTLLYNDSASTIVNVGANGLVLNNTILASKPNVTLIDSTEAATGAIQNNIALNTALTTAHCFAPYMTNQTPYTLPSYLTQNAELAYQLHEHSAMINAGCNDTELPAIYNGYRADSVISFYRDRDILGNPRKIGGRADFGALETWRVEPNTAAEITAMTNEVLDTRITTAPYAELCASFKTHYGGNAYPHPGSVVYLMDSSAMTMAYDNPLDFENMIFRPGYMLLKQGASFYGNGHDVQMNYLAAEKRFINQRYSMTAFPFAYNTANITTTNYYPAKDSLGTQLSTLDFNTYQYSGAARSAKDYVFQPQQSSTWLPVDTTNRSACDGYLMDFGSAQDTILRFTAFASTLGQYVYTEDENEKTVYLTQYDNRTAGTGTGLNFTRQEDMGWNMKGLPWLVSDYRTDTIVETGSFQRQMYIPHVFYQMDGAGEYISSGSQIYTSRSWDKGATLSMGNAFLTQTATQQNREPVLFKLPLYGRNEKAARPLIRMMSNRNQSDILTVMPDSAASKNVQYSYGRDGVKWLTNDNAAQVYLLDSKRQSRISLLGSAPTEVDIPLGVMIPASTDQQATTNNYTFTLPEKEAFNGYKYVWLIDNQLNRTVNLLEQDYETDIAAGEHNKRFAIRFGGFPKTDDKGNRQYIVFAYGGTLYVRGLVDGDQVTIYSPSGHIIYSTTAASSELSIPLDYQSGYIIKVNDTAHKVVNI